MEIHSINKEEEEESEEKNLEITHPHNPINNRKHISFSVAETESFLNGNNRHICPHSRMHRDNGNFTSNGPRGSIASRSSTETTNSVMWKTCCFYIDRRCVIYTTQVFFSFVILLFACVQIMRDSNDCTNSLLSWYCSIIGTIVGAWARDPHADKHLEPQKTLPRRDTRRPRIGRNRNNYDSDSLV